MQYYNPYQYYYQPTQQYNRPNALLGKVVDNLEAVKSADILLDGSTSYYPLADGSAIASKQLQQDGTSRIVVYKPIEKPESVKYITESDLSSIKEELETLKRELKEVKHESNAAN